MTELSSARNFAESEIVDGDFVPSELDETFQMPSKIPDVEALIENLQIRERVGVLTEREADVLSDATIKVKDHDESLRSWIDHEMVVND